MKLTGASLCLILASFATMGVAKEIEAPIDQIAGVYKLRKPNGIYNGVDAKGENIIDEYISEDVLEIVPYKKDSFYFRKATMFFNGHPCNIFDVAVKTEPNIYLFDDNEDDPRRHCQLKIAVSKSKLDFEDITPRNESLKWQESCHSYCGARGTIGDSWERSKKRSIRYMPRLKNSIEYKAAIESYESKISLHKARDIEWEKAR